MREVIMDNNNTDTTKKRSKKPTVPKRNSALVRTAQMLFSALKKSNGKPGPDKE